MSAGGKEPQPVGIVTVFAAVLALLAVMMVVLHGRQALARLLHPAHHPGNQEPARSSQR